MTSDVASRTGRVAAIYARVSSERQRQDETIRSQTVGLRELAADRGLLVAEDLIFEDEGFSGAMLQRPALERLRDRAAEGAFEVLLCHAPDRLARRYAYQVLLLEELARAGVEVVFAKEPERGGSPEDELLRQFQGMIAEYERAQIAERTRRGKLHRARSGSQAVMSGAPYGYRYVKKSDHMEGFWEIDETQAQVVRDVFDRYVNGGVSIGELARGLTERGVQTKTGKTRWDRSTIWAMLRNPAYRGQAAFGKTKTAERPGGPTRTTRQRGERHGRRLTRHDQPAENWTLIPVPPLVTEETFALAQDRLLDNAHFAKRNTKELTLLQGVLVCRECGYSCYRASTRTSNKRISYYRCIGQDGWRHPDGKRCTSGPVRADELDPLVWAEVRRLLEHPDLVRAEIDRRLAAVRTEHPAARRREALERDLTRASAAVERLIEAYQEQLISLDELRARMPALRKRQTALQAQLDSLDAELHDVETYLQLADTLEGFLGRLADGLDQLDVPGQQRILRLVVREILIGGDDDTVTIRHTIPTPTGPDDPSYLLRGSSHHTALRSSLLGVMQSSLLDHARLHPLPDHSPGGERAEPECFVDSSGRSDDPCRSPAHRPTRTPVARPATWPGTHHLGQRDSRRRVSPRRSATDFTAARSPRASGGRTEPGSPDHGENRRKGSISVVVIPMASACTVSGNTRGSDSEFAAAAVSEAAMPTARPSIVMLITARSSGLDRSTSNRASIASATSKMATM